MVFALILASFVAPAYGQIPNPGFETWSGVVGYDTPTGWFTSFIPGYAIPITESADAHSGALAVKGEVVNAVGFGLVPPALWAYFPYAQRPGALTGYYKFTSVSKDTLIMFVVLYKGSLFIPVASGEFGTATTVTAYTKFSLPLDYYDAATPDSAWFETVVDYGLDDTLHLGTTFLIDDLAFEGTATGVDDQQTKPAGFALEQNYPNPFNPETSIRYDLPEQAHVRLAIYNPLGQNVATLIDEEEPSGSYQVKFNAGTLSSGVYFYRLEATPVSAGLSTGPDPAGTSESDTRSFVQTRRLLLLR
jgi:hypothetical protein